MAQAPKSSASPVQSAIPTLNVPFVDSNGHITIPWFRLLLSFWTKLGSGQFASAASAYLVNNTTTGLVDVYSSSTNTKLGSIQYQPLRGGTPVPVVVGASPTIYTAGVAGYLLVSIGKVELSRGGSGFQQLSLVGGYFAMEPADSIRMTWQDALNPPTVVWYPYI